MHVHEFSLWMFTPWPSDHFSYFIVKIALYGTQARSGDIIDEDKNKKREKRKAAYIR